MLPSLAIHDIWRASLRFGHADGNQIVDQKLTYALHAEAEREVVGAGRLDASVILGWSEPGARSTCEEFVDVPPSEPRLLQKPVFYNFCRFNQPFSKFHPTVVFAGLVVVLFERADGQYVAGLGPILEVFTPGYLLSGERSEAPC